SAAPDGLRKSTGTPRRGEAPTSKPWSSAGATKGAEAVIRSETREPSASVNPSDAASRRRKVASPGPRVAAFKTRTSPSSGRGSPTAAEDGPAPRIGSSPALPPQPGHLHNA